jgi:hypothetical protein
MVLGLSACGESTSSSAVAAPVVNGQKFIARLNAVCDLENQQEDAVGPQPRINLSDPTEQDLRAAAAFLDKQLPILQTVISGMGQLGVPPQNRQAFDGALAALRKAASDARAADEAAKTDDPNSFKSGLGSYKSDVAQADGLIHTQGTTDCAPPHSDSTGGSPPSSGASPSTTS